MILENVEDSGWKCLCPTAVHMEPHPLWHGCLGNKRECAKVVYQCELSQGLIMGSMRTLVAHCPWRMGKQKNRLTAANSIYLSTLSLYMHK
jgi:hypothetical protein